MKKYLLLGLVGLLFSAPAWAAPTANSVITAQTPKAANAQLGATASCTGSGAPYPCCTGSAAGCVAGTNYAIYTGGTNGSMCWGGMMNDSDTATHAITFQILSTPVTTKGPGTIITTTASGVSGTFTVPQAVTTAAAWPGLGLDSNGNPFVMLNANDTLNWAFATAITSGDVVDTNWVCADF